MVWDFVLKVINAFPWTSSELLNLFLNAICEKYNKA